MKSIVVPCYNEAKNIPSLVTRFAAIHEEASDPRDSRDSRDSRDWELILVNNGSTDDSADVLARETAAHPFIRVVTVPSPNVGYGHGIVTGLRAAKGDYLAWTHADGQTPPRDVLTAFDVLTSSAHPEATFVKGRRCNRPVKDTLFTFGMQAAAAVLLRESLADINGQPKAFPRRLLDLAEAPPIDLSLDLYFLFVARRAGFEVKTIDVHFGDREHGESKWSFNWKSKARNIARTVKFMNALRAGDAYPHA